MLTERISLALALAVEAHDQQVRKGTQIPYVAHPMGVASLALDFGADEDQAVAALLHDVLEDGGPHFASVIEDRFGSIVLALVQGCTDGVPDSIGEKAPWEQRKQAYLAHLADADSSVLLVSGADKVHNARAILSDLQTIGPAVFERFTGKKEGTLWYYRSLAAIFAKRQVPMHAALSNAVGEIERLAATH